ncbi:BTAD domain-containing putative transcriptional regulator [Actinoplanes sp. NBRC 103695]|uniref:BTAD domain-containing putative transcriptional regulator n=1 Tax=Actinoplanes sp. NBRC 103695 TaxID=3032202 RepID=UPI0024A2423B|nr:BTAD domain-containing putative transcriptional regulator [Actinoplanes sp. NBRC 103695]GLY99973.1 SARP family transcriptional regulator [Actinoplanes sp. NBRC 103695]
MRITTLGSLAVDGRPVRGDRLAAVIRELVEARGRAVSTGALVDAVWQGAPPEDAVGAVQALVGRVRRLGVPVLAAPGGYRIPADQVEIDAVAARALIDRGRRALAEGDVAGARGCADQARELFPEVPELTDTSQTRLFGDAVGLGTDAALAGGGPFDDADLRRLATRVPPDEPAAALLVRVLAAQGRDAEALELVERVRAELADRYGTDPSPVLAEAHLALLRGRLVRPSGIGDLPAAWRRAATPLVGRDSDLAAVGKALLTAPVVTVVAAGGAGKTRLAAEIARSVSGSRPVRVVELAGLRSPAEVLPAVLAVLGGAGTDNPVPDHRVPNPEHRVPNPEQPVPNPAARVLGASERLKAIGSEFDGLLVLDNCEHVLDAAATVVADLLAVASPEVSVLATSRAPLGLLGEVVHRLPALADDEALDLLDARVRAGGTAPAWTRDQALALSHRLDNLPLALELAAARLRHMPIGDVLAGLGDRFALLDDALRGMPERHSGLWAMVDWSRELLEPAEQDLLRRLAVIPAPFTTEPAVAVAGGADVGVVRPGRESHRVRRSLSILVEQSLLRLDENRYRMLETVREYGEAGLDASGERATAMAGLVRWARERAVALAADFIGPAQVKALEGCAGDQDNLLAALRWTLDHDDEPAAVDIAVALFQLWTVRGRHYEAGAWARILLRLDDPAARPRSAILHGRTSGRTLPHADRLAWLCVLIAVNAGSTASSRLIALARRALRTLFAERPGDVSSRVTALAGALSGLEHPDPDTSLADAATLIANPDPYVQGMGHFFRAVLTENTTTRHDAELAYRRFQTAGDHWGMAMAAHAAGHAAGTDTWLRRSEQHLELVGAAQDARSTRVLLDTQLALAGDAEAERRLLETARADDGAETDACQADLALAQLALRRGRHDEALAHTGALLRTIGVDDGPAQQRAVFRIAAAVVDLWIAEARAATETTAADTLRQSRTEVLTAHDRPLLGAWAMAGAELAAFRGETATARELWALGTRVGANVSRFFPQGRGVRLATVLGDRDSLLAEAGKLTGVVVYGRITTLMDDLLA